MSSSALQFRNGLLEGPQEILLRAFFLLGISSKAWELKRVGKDRCVMRAIIKGIVEGVGQPKPSSNDAKKTYREVAVKMNGGDQLPEIVKLRCWNQQPINVGKEAEFAAVIKAYMFKDGKGCALSVDVY